MALLAGLYGSFWPSMVFSGLFCGVFSLVPFFTWKQLAKLTSGPYNKLVNVQIQWFSPGNHSSQAWFPDRWWEVPTTLPLAWSDNRPDGNLDLVMENVWYFEFVSIWITQATLWHLCQKGKHLDVWFEFKRLAKRPKRVNTLMFDLNLSGWQKGRKG